MVNSAYNCACENFISAGQAGNMANPDWAVNLLERTETLGDFLRRNAHSTSSGLSSFTSYFTTNLSTEGPLPPGRIYRSLGRCAGTNFVEGCSIGGGISVLVSTLPALLKGNVRRAVKDIPTLGNLRVALFFGILMSTCNSALYLQRKAQLERPLTASELNRVRLLIGLVSGMSVAVLPKGVRRFIVYLLLTRAFEIAVRLLKGHIRERRARTTSKPGVVNGESVTEAPTPSLVTIKEAHEAFSSHEVVGLASVSMTVIVTAWFRYTELVPGGYLRFLEGINNLTATQVSDIQHILKGDTEFNPQVTKVVHREDRVCSVYHPEDQACLSFYLRFLLKGILTRSGPFYLKLYLLPLLFSIVRRKGKNVSLPLAISFLKRVWWSSLFLGTMNATAAGTVCALSHLRPLSYHRAIPLTVHASLGGYMSGLSLYLEQHSRRLELALYLFGQAIQILVNVYKRTGIWYPSHMDSLVTAGSISLILYAFWEEADRTDVPADHIPIIRPGYASLISKIIDTSNRRHSFVIGKEGLR